MFKLIFPIAFIHKPFYHTAISTELSFHTDIRPSFDGYTFATRLAQKGIDIHMISILLGHKDIRMTQRYAHHCPESLRIGVEVLENDYNLTTSKESVFFT